MTDIEWPEGATHRVNDYFAKWIDGLEFVTGGVSSYWVEASDPWTLNQYMDSANHEVIERPKEPETEPYQPEVGEWFIASGGAKMAFVGIDSGNAYVCEIDGGGLTRLYDFAGCHPIKSEREQFIEKSLNINGAPKDWGEMFGMLYDNGARFTDE